jgi:hypothetical protein
LLALIPPRPSRASVRACLAFVLACGLWVAPSVHALDYDRNDVLTRGVGVGFALAPILGNCRTCSAPPVTFARGFAGRQTRFLYFDIEAQLGVIYNGHPWVSRGGAVGGETADSAFVKLRGYAELGVAMIWMSQSLSDTLNFSGEVGLRYQVRSYSRPHTLLYIGARGLSNFNHIGAMIHAGLMWTFD